jgi:hypothetical protein
VRRSATPNLLVQFPLAELTLQLTVDPSKNRRSIPARADGRSYKSRRSIPARADGRSRQPPQCRPSAQTPAAPPASSQQRLRRKAAPTCIQQLDAAQSKGKPLPFSPFSRPATCHRLGKWRRQEERSLYLTKLKYCSSVMSHDQSKQRLSVPFFLLYFVFSNVPRITHECLQRAFSQRTEHAVFMAK